MNRRHFLLLSVAVLILATALRLTLLDAQSFWNDEGNSARLSERSVKLIIEGTASDIHPPLYYLLLGAWRRFVGESEYSLRLLSAIFGIGVTALTIVVGRLLWGRRRWLALLGGGVIAVNPALIYYSQETRMYQLLTFLAILATWLLFKGEQRQRASRPWLLWGLAYVMTLAAGLYTHYFFPTIIIIHNGWFLIRWVRQRLWRTLWQWGALMGITLLLYAPWLPIFWRQAGGRVEALADSGTFWLEISRFVLLGHTLPTGRFPLIAAGLLLLCVCWVGLKRNRLLLMLAIAILFPLLFMTLTGATRPAFFKFALVVVPFVGVVLPAGFALAQTLPSQTRRLATAFVSLLFGALFLGNFQSLNNLYTDPSFARADYRAMAARIAADNHSNAAIILNAANQWEVFTYYHTEGAPVFPVPRGNPAAAAIDAELSTIAAQHDRIYAILWGEAERDPERLVERWLDTHGFKATDEWVGDVRFVMYAIPSEPATKIAEPLALHFGNDILLDGLTLATTQYQSGDVIGLTLFWHAQRPIEARYKVFLHLLDEQGQIVGQRDSEPSGGLALTSRWVPGGEVIDNHGVLIPAGTPAGNYTIRLGLYDIADPAARLMVETDDGQFVDNVIIANIMVETPD